MFELSLLKILSSFYKLLITLFNFRWKIRSNNFALGGIGNSILPCYVENSLCLLCTELAVYFLISCEILVARSSAKFEYFLKSMHDYHFVQVSLSSEMALIIQGQYEHCFQYMARYHIYLVVSDWESSNEKTSKEQDNLDMQFFPAFFCGLLQLRSLLQSFWKTWCEVDYK